MRRCLFLLAGVIFLTASIDTAQSGGALLMHAPRTSFNPITHTYTPSSPGTGSETVPTGATSVTITIRSGGGGGGASGGGGGGGAEAISTYAIVVADWSGTISYAVGAGGGGNVDDSGDEGGTSSATGTINAGSIAISAGCNIGGQPPGCGGAAFGGSGGEGAGAAGGNASDLNGSNGAGGFPEDGSGGMGAGGAPAGGAGTANPGIPGGAGSVIFAWS